MSNRIGPSVPDRTPPYGRELLVSLCQRLGIPLATWDADENRFIYLHDPNPKGNR